MIDTVLTNTQGDPIGFVGVSEDITDRKQMDETLRASEEQYRSLFESNPHPMWVYDMATLAFLAVNDAAVGHYGYLRAEFLSMTIEDLHVAEDVPLLLDIVRDLPGRYRTLGVWQQKQKDGTLIDAEITTHDMLFDRREARLVQANDITVRKQAEEALHQYSERLEILNDLDQSILTAQSSRAIAETTLHHVGRLVPYQRSSVTLSDFAAGEAIVFAGDAGSQPQFITETRVPLESFGHTPPFINAPLVVEGELIGTLNLLATRPHTFTPEHIEFAREVAQRITLAIRQAQLHEQVRAGHERLRALSRQLLEVHETERRAIARELHDEIGQALTAVKLDLQTVQRSTDAAAVVARLDDSIANVEHALQTVRHLSLDLRPSLLDDLGLVAALRWYVDRQAQRAGFTAQVDAETLPARPSPEIETICFRVAQEALTNIVRHAQAQQVTVELRERDAALEMTVRDNGRGFDVRAARERALRGASLGLLSMEERVMLGDA